MFSPWAVEPLRGGCTALCNVVFHRFGPYYTEPVIAGLDPVTHEPFICSLDLIGCPMVTDDFVVSGTCSEQMYGMCESLWEPDMVSEVARPSSGPGLRPLLWTGELEIDRLGEKLCPLVLPEGARENKGAVAYAACREHLAASWMIL